MSNGDLTGRFLDYIETSSRVTSANSTDIETLKQWRSGTVDPFMGDMKKDMGGILLKTMAAMTGLLTLAGILFAIFSGGGGS